MSALRRLVLIVIPFLPVLAAGKQRRSLSAAAIFHRVRSSVVVILGERANQRVQGSGFIIGANRIITNYHVIDGLDRMTVVYANGERAKVSRVILDDSQEDFAVLKSPTGSRKPLVMGDVLSLHEGDPVLAIGASRGMELTISNGIVSGFRTIGTRLLIQTTATIATGSTGGPLLDMKGHVVGITTLLQRGSPGIYFSVGIDPAKSLLLGENTEPSGFTNASKGNSTSPNLDVTFDWIKQKIESAGDTTIPNSLIALSAGDVNLLLQAASRTALEGGLPVLDQCSDSGFIHRDRVSLTRGSSACMFVLQYQESLPACRHGSIDPDLLHGSDVLELMNTPHVGCEESWKGSFTVSIDMRFLKSALPFVAPKAVHVGSEPSDTNVTGVILIFSGAGKVITHQNAAKIRFSDCQLTALSKSLPANSEVGKFVRALASQLVSEGSQTEKDMKDSILVIPVNGDVPGLAPPDAHAKLAHRLARAFQHAGKLCELRRPSSAEPF